jgi:nucleoside-diphosphate-sugar epimerase
MVRAGSDLRRLKPVAAQVRLLQADLADRDRVHSAVRDFKPKRCIHLAWYAEPGKYLHAPENLTSHANSLALLQDLIANGCAQVVMAGTCAECDVRQQPLREDGPTDPGTLYAAAKHSLYLMAREMARRASINLAWGRIFYLYGQDEDERRAIPALITALLAGREFPATAGTQVRDYLHVHDVAAAFVALADGAANGIYHIAAGEGTTMRILMEQIGRLVGRPELIRFGVRPQNDWDPPEVVGENGRMRSTGWSPRIGLDNGLRTTVAWWQEQERERP